MDDSIFSLNFNGQSNENLSGVSTSDGKGDEIWRRTWNLYCVMAKSPLTNIAKRQALHQRAIDVKQQYKKTVRQANLNQEKLVETMCSALRRLSKTMKTVFEWIRPFCCALPYFAIIGFMIIILYAISSGVIFSSQKLLLMSPSTITLTSEQHQTIKKETHQYSSTILIVIWIIPIIIVFLLFYFIVSKWSSIRRIFIFIWSLPFQLSGFRLNPTHDARSSSMNFESKILLLDPTLQHSNLHSLLESHLLVYTSVSDCFHDLNANRSLQYILFLSSATFQLYLINLQQWSHVSLYVFYDDSERAYNVTPNRDSQIQFIFPETRLIEYLRHALILNYAKRAYLFRLQGLDREADESFSTASNQCRILADEFEKQVDTAIGRDAQSILSDNDEAMVELHLPTFTFDESD